MRVSNAFSATDEMENIDNPNQIPTEERTWKDEKIYEVLTRYGTNFNAWILGPIYVSADTVPFLTYRLRNVIHEFTVQNNLIEYFLL